MDRDGLAEFLRVRREALRPEDVGLVRGPRRRTGGLRREEVAALTGMSTDYYGRLEQRRGPQPSEQMLAALARGLRLSLDERDHLFRLAGHNAPDRPVRTEHVAPGLMRILDRLHDTPAQVMVSGSAETLVQTRLAVALLGDQTRFTGLARSMVYRWFTDPASRDVYPPEDHAGHGRFHTAMLREAVTRLGPSSRAAEVAEALRGRSEEFTRLWAQHPVGGRYSERKTFENALVGRMELHCQVLLDPDRSQTLLVFTATPGSEDDERLRLLSVVGTAGAYDGRSAESAAGWDTAEY
jgi:transcriptional regulator with XRE-family HTH domain